MEGNKDDALKCLRIGKVALESGDRSRAMKFLTKARRLDPTLPIDDLISTIDPDSPADPPPSTDPVAEAAVPNKPPGNSPSPRARVSANGSASASSSFTEEQIAIVRQIKRQKDYYEILAVEKGCSIEDIRKAYRKLSLKVHPDKNKAPGAEEAFKAVSKAFQCLSDEESRKRYDLVGSEEEVVYERPARRGTHHGFNGFYDEVDAEEIFRNFFFGGGMPPATASFGTFRFGTGMGPSAGRNVGAHGSGNTNLRALIQILPVLLLLLLNFIPSSEPIYSLSRTHSYQYQFLTEKGVPYYVKTSKFEEEYPIQGPERTALETRVEREYYSVLTQNCRVELQRRQWGLSYQTPHCDMLKDFEARA